MHTDSVSVKAMRVFALIQKSFLFSHSRQAEACRLLMKKISDTRKNLVNSDFFSLSILLLAMPTLGLMIQSALFLFGKTCSPFPMWTSFLLFSLLALLIHWKCLFKFWGLIFLALFFTSFTFSYFDFDAENYHIPMQMLLKEGWNPVFDSTVEEFSVIADGTTFSVYHTLFLPKTVALCGALVADATGLWIADSFLGYILFFVLVKTSYIFARKTWNCSWKSANLFAAAISFNTKFSVMIDGRIDFHTYTALMIALFSLALYWREHRLHDFILSILATAICCTTKSTGLLCCTLMWILFAVFSLKNRAIYCGIPMLILLIAWIGMSPLMTAWIQYGSPFYPSMTFDPKVAVVDITSDFRGNTDAEQMGYLARTVYSWFSTSLATKACAWYYNKADFNPVFSVTGGINGLKELNLLLFVGVILLLLAKKNIVTFACLFILVTLVLCPVKYIGYGRYFPQAWAVIPMGFFQFACLPPSWIVIRPKLKIISQYCLYGVIGLLICFSFIKILSFQVRSMILEGRRQAQLADMRENGMVFMLPKNSNRTFTLSRRLTSAGVASAYGQYAIDTEHLEEDKHYPQYQNYYLEFWKEENNYPICNTPASFLRFRWLDVFKTFPHPLFCHQPQTPEPFPSAE